jgi:protein SCO1/2
MNALLGGALVLLAAQPTRWGADYFPNTALTTHQGKKVRFFDDLIEDKVVVINFIYTSCPDACPLETARLVEVQRLLRDRMGKDVFFYSISMDPATDTPAVLAAYARRYRAGPGWLFLTGDEQEIKTLRRKLGLYPTGGEERLKDHNLSLLMGNQATGQWMKRSPFENAHMLASQIGDWLDNWRRPPRPGQDYAHAPALRQVSSGESLYRTRCAPCHRLGPEDGNHRAGPNLTGVMQRRDRGWLARWLAAPDEMLAAGDPTAVALYGSFNKVPMPNLRLEPADVTALLGYLDGAARPPAGARRRSGRVVVKGQGRPEAADRE